MAVFLILLENIPLKGKEGNSPERIFMGKSSVKKCLVDTNILVALLNSEHENHSQAVNFFEKIKKGEYLPFLSIQNLFELSAVLIHGYKRGRKETADIIQTISGDPLFQIIYPDFRVVGKFIINLEKENRLHVADEYLLATMEVFEIPLLISGDRELAKVKNSSVAVYNPFKQM